MLIRNCAPRDFEDLAVLRHELWPVDPVDKHVVELKNFTAQDNFAAFVAEHAGKLVGFAELSIRAAANGCESAPVPFLEGIFVEPGSRRRGVGAQLIAAVESWCKARGFNELGSDTELENLPSQQAHSAWGFSETERVVYFRKPLR
jgi:aminoglycoside 6'-N-acetyltransferase I